MTSDAPRPLRELREDRAWGVRELAEAAGVAPSTVFRIESGASMRPGSVRAIAKALGVTPADIREYVDRLATPSTAAAQPPAAATRAAPVADQPATLDEALARRYPFAVVPEPRGGYDIIFPDLPGCSSYAATLAEIGPMASEAAESWLTSMFERNYPIPAPSTDWDPSPPWPTEPIARLDGQPAPEPEPIYSTEDVAELFGLTAIRIRQLAARFGAGTKVAGVWMFTPADVVAMQGRPGRGRPIGGAERPGPREDETTAQD